MISANLILLAIAAGAFLIALVHLYRFVKNTDDRLRRHDRNDFLALLSIALLLLLVVIFSPGE